MRFFRSFLFNAFYYVETGVMGILWLPILFFGTRSMNMRGIEIYVAIMMKALKFFCNLDFEIRGRENIPDGPVIIASKHQSMWEALMFHNLVKDPAMILKRELTWLPFFGWYAMRTRMISINRGAAARALRDMIGQAKDRVASGRSVVIFPEGTRRPPHAEPDYKPGIAALYAQLDRPCVPVALNSGLFWPRRTIVKNPGTMVLEFLPPIPPGLKRKQFMARLEAETEAATARLLAEGEKAASARK